MRRSSLLRSRGGGSVIDADYQAVLDQAIIQGYTLPSANQQIIQNQLVLDMKSAGVWSKLDFFYNNVNDGSVEFTLINWVNPTQEKTLNLTFTIWVSNYGYTQVNNTSTEWFFTTDAVNYTQDSASFGYKMGADPIINGNQPFIISNNNPYSSPYMTVYVTNRASINSSINAQVGIGTILAPNFFTVINRDNSATFESYVDGVLLTSLNATSVGIPTGKVTLYRSNTAWNGTFQMEFLGGALTPTEIADFYTAYSDYLGAI